MKCLSKINANMKPTDFKGFLLLPINNCHKMLSILSSYMPFKHII